MGQDDLLPPNVEDLISEDSDYDVYHSHDLRNLLCTDEDDQFQHSNFDENSHTNATAGELSSPRSEHTFRAIRAARFVRTNSVCSNGLTRHVAQFRAVVGRPVKEEDVSVTSTPISFCIVRGVDVLVESTVFRIGSFDQVGNLSWGTNFGIRVEANESSHIATWSSHLTYACSLIFFGRGLERVSVSHFRSVQVAGRRMVTVSTAFRDLSAGLAIGDNASHVTLRRLRVCSFVRAAAAKAVFENSPYREVGNSEVSGKKAICHGQVQGVSLHDSPGQVGPAILPVKPMRFVDKGRRILLFFRFSLTRNHGFLRFRVLPSVGAIYRRFKGALVRLFGVGSLLQDSFVFFCLDFGD